MANYDFDRVYNRKGSGCFKADALQMLYGRDDLLSLWVADMDFAIAPEIQEALQNRLQHPIFGYNFRLSSYYDSIINWVDDNYHWQIKPEWIINTPGIVTALNVAALVFTNPGDNIMVQTPVYDPFFEAAIRHKRNLLVNPLKLINNKYEIDFDDFEQKISKSKLFFLCNPHNPVGRVWTEDELLQIGRLCRKYKVIVVSDEIHADIVYSGYKHIAFCGLEDFAEFTITCYSPSKSFNLAGLCTSAIIIPAENIRKPFNEYVFAVHLYLGNTFGIVALQAAYSRGENWLKALLIYLEQNRDYLINFFVENLPHLPLIKAEGTYLAWIDFRNLNKTDYEILDLLTNEAGLALNMGKTYGMEGSGFVRLNFGCPRSILKNACERLYNTFQIG